MGLGLGLEDAHQRAELRARGGAPRLDLEH